MAILQHLPLQPTSSEARAQSRYQQVLRPIRDARSRYQETHEQECERKQRQRNHLSVRFANHSRLSIRLSPPQFCQLSIAVFANLASNGYKLEKIFRWA